MQSAHIDAASPPPGTALSLHDKNRKGIQTCSDFGEERELTLSAIEEAQREVQ